MSIESSNLPGSQNGNCKDTDAQTATQKSLHQLKEDYCKRLKAKSGELSESEVSGNGTLMMYEKKKCAFVNTEKNYLLVRNLELKVGIELMQASDEIKKNVAASISQNEALVLALKAVLKTAKEAKVKFAELRDSASKLDACMKDSCSAGQLKLLGCAGDDCNDQHKQAEANKLPGDCQNACRILDELVHQPPDLSQDIDIIVNAAAEIIGIQSFSNIKTLEKFQQDFALNAKNFDDLILLQMAGGGAGLKKAQEELSLAIKTLTQSGYALYNKRNEVETLVATKHYLCCHKCSCIGDCGCNDEKSDENNRFKKCKCDICDICKEVTDIYCLESSSGNAGCD